MEYIRIPIKKLNPNIKTPQYMTSGSVGLDLYSTGKFIIYPNFRMLIPTGISIAIPEGYEGQIRTRSGSAYKNGLFVLNSPGTIDSDYRGELGVIIANFSDRTQVIREGDRIAQIIFAPITKACFEEVDELPGTERGSGGFGSTG